MPATNPFISILNGFAEATQRLAHEVRAGRAVVEREVHHRGERPEGDGWVPVERDPSGYMTWERWSTVREAARAD